MWLLEQLNHLASELLENAEALQSHIETTEDLTKGFERIQKWLDGFCEILGSILTLLTHPESPLPGLVQLTTGGNISGDLGKLQLFLADHRATLTRLGVNESAIQRVMDALKEEVRPGGDADLTKSQTLDPDVIGT